MWYWGVGASSAGTGRPPNPGVSQEWCYWTCMRALGSFVRGNFVKHNPGKRKSHWEEAWRPRKEMISVETVTQSCLTLCDPMDFGPPDSSVHGISQARILEHFAVSSSRGSSQPASPALAGWFFTTEPPANTDIKVVLHQRESFSGLKPANSVQKQLAAWKHLKNNFSRLLDSMYTQHNFQH